MGRILGVISSKGGVGKTTVSINLSAALMKTGRNVVLVDSDIKMSGVGLQLGMYSLPKTINDVLGGKSGSILEAMCIHSSGLRIVPASLCLKDAKINKLRKVIRQPCLEGSKVIVDTPPGMEKNTLSIIGSVDDVVIVTTPDIPSVADAMKSIKSAKEAGCNVLGIIVNRYNKKRFSQVRLNEIEYICEVPLLGVIPDDKNIEKSIFMRAPLLSLKPKSPASRSFMEIARRIHEIEANHVHKGGVKA